MNKICLMVVGLMMAVAGFSQPAFRLPSLLSDHAVLQQQSDVTLWGWSPGVWTIKIVCSWNPADTVIARSGKDCSWKTTVRTPVKGGPYAISFIGDRQTITINDILIGEVWLCSGQSNMEFNAKWGISDAGNDLTTADNQEIRFFQVAPDFAQYPKSDCPGEWKRCTPESAAGFSSVGYFFGRKINAQLKVPVGLIGSYWGGTSIQPWTPNEVYTTQPELAKRAGHIQASWAPVAPARIYNAMIYPLLPYRLAGVLWYQGEANNGEPLDYGPLFSGLIAGWRKSFGQNLHFYFVQIAPWNGYSGINGALLREQQTTALRLPKTGMVSVGDLVDDISDVHPRRKREVGFRMANLVLSRQYGIQDLPARYPVFTAFQVIQHKVMLSLRSTGKLICEGDTIRNFLLAGKDRKFYPAIASLDASGKIQLVSDSVPKPVAVRYCFTNDAIPNLFDPNGLPLLPFRTDRWPQ